jgi:hypothetical protein
VKCRPEQISALVDGDLSPREERKLREHAASCVTCRAALDDFEALKHALGGAPQLDGGDHWLELASKLPSPRPAPRRWLRPAWLMVPALGGALAAAVLWRTTPRGPSDDQLIAQAEDEFRRADAQYRHALEKLEGVTRKLPLDENRRKQLDGALAQLSAATEECRKVARERPSDADAEALLFDAYRKQITFLERQLLEARQ